MLAGVTPPACLPARCARPHRFVRVPWTTADDENMARPEGLEPPTTRFEAWYSDPAELRARDGKSRR